MRSSLPSALTCFPDITLLLSKRHPVLFLDYDGTLTPIVARPELARASERMRQTLARLADACPTILLTGRSRANARELLRLDSVEYIGCHGLEFENDGPEKLDSVRWKSVISEVARELEHSLSPIPGFQLEIKPYTVAVHHRHVADADRPRLERLVSRAVEGRESLCQCTGKRVIEVRPATDWNKGKALSWVLSHRFSAVPAAIPVMIGDDTTDEDAFQAVLPDGLPILVAQAPRTTAAKYQLQHVDEVGEFLDRLLDIL